MKMPPEFKLAKTLPGASQMERVVAARAILNGTRQMGRRAEVRAFLSIFHPEMTEESVRAFLAGVAE